MWVYQFNLRKNKIYLWYYFNDKNKLIIQFTDIKNILNLNGMKCYKKLLETKGIKNNIGFNILFYYIFSYNIFNYFYI